MTSEGTLFQLLTDIEESDNLTNSLSVYVGLTRYSNSGEIVVSRICNVFMIDEIMYYDLFCQTNFWRNPIWCFIHRTTYILDAYIGYWTINKQMNIGFIWSVIENYSWDMQQHLK